MGPAGCGCVLPDQGRESRRQHGTTNGADEAVRKQEEREEVDPVRALVSQQEQRVGHAVEVEVNRCQHGQQVPGGQR